MRELDLTRDSFSRFLRAGGKVELDWFLSLDESDQEIMAEVGDDFREDIVIATGYAVADPDAAAAGMGIEEAEEKVLARIGAALLAGGPGNGSSLPSAGLQDTSTPENSITSPDSTKGKRDPLWGVTSPTMGGISERQRSRHQTIADNLRESMTLMGRKSDQVEIEK